MKNSCGLFSQVTSGRDFSGRGQIPVASSAFTLMKNVPIFFSLLLNMNSPPSASLAIHTFIFHLLSAPQHYIAESRFSL